MTKAPHDLDCFVAVAEAAADRAGEIIRPYFRSALQADAKADDSPVTVADREAERALRAVLSDAFPEHGVLGEEDGLDRPEARLRWVLDPIDGTRAFITGRPSFGTLIALLDGDRPLLGIVDQPVTGERWVGVAGRPTRFSGPFGGTAGARRAGALGACELSCTAPGMLTDATRPRWQSLERQCLRASWGGDCYAYGLLALGQIDVIAEHDMKLWDWAALVPVIEGAGGVVRDWAGQQLTPDSDGSVLALGDPALLAAAVAALAPG